MDSSRFGPGGIAGGLAAVAATPPDDGIWLVNPVLTNPPDDGLVAIGFLLNPAGEVMGIQPEPFRIFLGIPPDDGMPDAGPTLIGWLDFSIITGSRGSLNLSGLQVVGVDAAGVPTGEIFDVDPFTLQAVSIPVPAAVWMGLGLFGLPGASRGLRRGRY